MPLRPADGRAFPGGAGVVAERLDRPQARDGDAPRCGRGYGPRLTLSETFAPRARRSPPTGLCLSTMPRFTRERTRVTLPSEQWALASSTWPSPACDRGAAAPRSAPGRGRRRRRGRRGRRDEAARVGLDARDGDSRLFTRDLPGRDGDALAVDQVDRVDSLRAGVGDSHSPNRARRDRAGTCRSRPARRASRCRMRPRPCRSRRRRARCRRRRRRRAGRRRRRRAACRRRRRPRASSASWLPVTVSLPSSPSAEPYSSAGKAAAVSPSGRSRWPPARRRPRPSRPGRTGRDRLRDRRR